jgi:hypothetical protein
MSRPPWEHPDTSYETWEARATNDALTPQQEELLSVWRQLSPARKALFFRMAEGMARRSAPSAKHDRSADA